MNKLTFCLVLLLVVLASAHKKSSKKMGNKNGLTYTYSVPFKDYNNKLTIQVKGVNIGKTVTLTTNFMPGSGWGTCFGVQYWSVQFQTTQKGTLYQVVMTNTDESTYLNFGSTCDLFGTNNGEALVLPGVGVPIISSLSVDGVKGTFERACEATNCKDPGNGFAIGGYYAQWGVWGRNYNPYSIPFDKMNQLYYAFIGFNPSDGSIKTLDSAADGWGLSAVATALLKYPYLEAYTSYGGWTNNGLTTAPMFETLSASQASMSRFANEAVALIRKLGFTGLDIDWEWWSDYNNAPATKVLGFLRTLKTALDAASSQDGKAYKLIYTVNGGKDRLMNMQSSSNPNAVSDFWYQVGSIVSQINIMNYDYHGGYDVGMPAYFQANFDFSNTGSYEVGAKEGWSVKASVEAYESVGVPSKKLVVGLPLYTRSMKVSGSANGGLFQTVTGPGFGDYEGGVFDYKCLVNPVNDPATGCGSSSPISAINSLEFYNSERNVDIWTKYGKGAYASWAYSASTQTFVTYDGPYDITQKVAFAKARGLKGVMYWEIDGDAAGNKSLIAIASTVFKGTQLYETEY